MFITAIDRCLNARHRSIISVSARKMIIILNDHIAQWTRDIERIGGVNGSGRNKLRSYRLFKTTYWVERYCSMHMSSSHRSAFAKFRCGVAPIRLETGRYEGLQESQRLCPFGCGVVKSEQHVLLNCPLYLHERYIILQTARPVIGDFTRLGEEELFCLLFIHPYMIRVVSKIFLDILNLRNNVLYSKISLVRYSDLLSYTLLLCVRL